MRLGRRRSDRWRRGGRRRFGWSGRGRVAAGGGVSVGGGALARGRPERGWPPAAWRPVAGQSAAGGMGVCGGERRRQARRTGTSPTASTKISFCARRVVVVDPDKDGDGRALSDGRHVDVGVAGVAVVQHLARAAPLGSPDDVGGVGIGAAGWIDAQTAPEVVVLRRIGRTPAHRGEVRGAGREPADLGVEAGDEGVAVGPQAYARRTPVGVRCGPSIARLPRQDKRGPARGRGPLRHRGRSCPSRSSRSGCHRSRGRPASCEPVGSRAVVS